ncbi:MAG: rod shape-determining protein MreD [Bacteroidales bacterium]|nr:rod shape-determining protein MreD [Bacteroidales bacterium]
MTNSSNIIKLLLIFVLCELTQLLIFNNLQISGFINPYVYILLILTMPFGTSSWLMMLVSFVLGIIIDIFCDTPGMHAGACVLIGYLRQYVLKYIAFRDEYKSDSFPTISIYGSVWYVKYALIMVSIHHVALFFIEQFDTIFFWPTLLRIVLSIVATMFFIIISQLFIRSKSSSFD